VETEEPQREAFHFGVRAGLTDLTAQPGVRQVQRRMREGEKDRGRRSDSSKLPVEKCGSSVGILLVLVKARHPQAFAIGNILRASSRMQVRY
jgi:hypothetical protein